jgi:hypothetical protein
MDENTSNSVSDAKEAPNGEIIIGDPEYDDRVILYVIKGR